MEVAQGIAQRVNSLEEFTLSWLKAQSRHLGLKPIKIALDPQDPRLASITFKKPEDAQLFAQTLFRAGSLIPFVPAQLSPDIRSFGEDVSTVIVQRKVGMKFNSKELNSYFQFIPKQLENEALNPVYQHLIADRAAPIALGFGKMTSQLNLQDMSDEALVRLARTVTDYEDTFGDQSAITQRYFGTFSSQPGFTSKLLGQMERISQKLGQELSSLKQQQSSLQQTDNFLDALQQQKLEIYQSQKSTLDAATTIIKRNIALFEKGPQALTYQEIMQQLSAPIPETKAQIIEIGARNPFINQVVIDWNHDRIDLVLHQDVTDLRNQNTTTENQALSLEKLNQLLFNEIAVVARESDEKITPSIGSFTIVLNSLTGSQSLLGLDVKTIAQSQVDNMLHLLSSAWNPQSIELKSSEYPVLSQQTYQTLGHQDKKLGMLVYAPVIKESAEEGFRPGSLYVIAKGLSTIRQKYSSLPEGAEKQQFEKDVLALQNLMRQNGFISYQGGSSNLPAAYRDDLIFELDDYTSYLLAATREHFSLKGSKRFCSTGIY